MFKTLGKFMDFSGPENKRKFHLSIFLGILMALCAAMKIPAVWVMVRALVAGNVTGMTCLACFGIIAASIAADMALNGKSNMLQTEAGYNCCAQKRISIAEHLRYLPMGYFNENSLGYITSVTTNTMEQLADVATRVVMMTFKGWLETLLIIAFLFAFQWQIGLVALAGVAVFYLVNTLMQKRNAHLAPVKTSSDSELVAQVLEYIQGIGEIKAYDLSGEQSERLDAAIEANRKINTDMEFGFVPYMAVQNFITKLTGTAMVVVSVALYLSGGMPLDICLVMLVASFMIYGALEGAGSFSAQIGRAHV